MKDEEAAAVEVGFAPGRADEVAGLLWELGTQGFEEKEAGRVLAYFPASQADQAMAVLRSQAGLTVASVPVPDVDWVARFREGFRAFEAAGFRVQPVWDPAPPSAQTLLVDPGRAFGTGTHETTRLCLAALRTLSGRGPLGAVLDYGSGTGLLAIAAHRLGARPVYAVDNDPEAAAATRAHAVLNRAAVHAVLGDGGACFRPGAFDLVLANVTAPLLRARHHEIAALRRPGGRLVLSGILGDELAGVAAAYAGAGALESTLRDAEWGALVIGP